MFLESKDNMCCGNFDGKRRGSRAKAVFFVVFFWRYVHSGDTATCSGRVSTAI